MKKKIPAFRSSRAAAAFVDKADLSQYDLSGAQTVRFEMKRKDKSINFFHCLILRIGLTIIA